MNKSAFLHIIQNTSAITTQKADELEELVVNFPYCQTAHLLIAKAAYDRGSMLSNQKLRKAASYATNRQLLKKLIYTTSVEVALKEVSTPGMLPPEVALAPPAPEPAFTTQLEAGTEPKDEKQQQGPVEEQLPAESWVETQPQEKTEALTEVLPDEAFSEAALEEQQAGMRLEEVAPAAKPAGEEDEMHEELAGLLYIERILPYRHLLAEASESLQGKEEEEQQEEPAPIVLEQFANPSLTEEEVAVLKALLKSEAETADAYEPETIETDVPEEAVEEERADEEEKQDELEPAEEDTLTQFDAFLFQPGQEPPARVEEAGEAVMVGYPAGLIEKIYAQNQLGYWMNSSRLGESLELKNELTTARPYYFYPELILEYVQVNGVEKQVRLADSPLDQQLNLIEQFLKLTPRLRQFGDAKVKPEPVEDLSSKSTKIKKNLASENLANIFLKQGKIKKAIKIYEHLLVKIPEKKAYFAEQIERLRNLTN